MSAEVLATDLQHVLWPRLVQIGCLVAYYILAAIEVSHQNGSLFQKRGAPWPSGAGAFCAGAGRVWVAVSLLMLGERSASPCLHPVCMPS